MGRRNKQKHQYEEEEEFEEDIDDIEDDNDEENEDDDDNSESNAEEESEHSSDDSEAVIYNKKEETENVINEEDENLEVNNEDVKEFNHTVNNIRESIGDVTKKVSNLISSLKTSEKADMKYGLSYLDAKNNMMLVYLTDLICYSLLKIKGEKINNHTVVKQLIYLKTILERSKVIDLKLKSQIDKLIKLGEKDGNAEVKEGQEAVEENNYRVY